VPGYDIGDSAVTQLYPIAVPLPYRLDLTVNVLRRLSTNLVDVLTPDGVYVRLLGDETSPALIRARQPEPGKIIVEIESDSRQRTKVLAAARRMLGLEVDLSRFYHSASAIPWLYPLVLRMRGVRPPRYPTLWEACVNAIVFQQISLHAASSIMRRFIVGLSERVEHGGVAVYGFPSIAQFQATPDRLLAESGLSAGKLATLRRVAEAVGTGVLQEAGLEQLPSAEASVLLRKVKGIGPWTAAVILLRGLGRLDVFPANDSSVKRNLILLGGPAPLELDALLTTLGPERGMLYYHLLLGRLEARGNLALSASVPSAARSAAGATHVGLTHGVTQPGSGC
jgi:DNA-3-methyladenine glycosylase II